MMANRTGKNALKQGMRCPSQLDYGLWELPCRFEIKIEKSLAINAQRSS